MGVRPPPSDDDDSTGTVEFGIAAVDAHLRDADLLFPATGTEVVEALSDPEIEYDPRGHTVRLSTVLEEVTREEFDTRNEFLNAVHPILEEYRTSSSPGIVSWVRSVLPF